MTPFTNWLPTDCSLPPATTSHPSQRPSGARGPAGGLVLHQLHQPEAGLPQFPAGAARGPRLLRSHGHLHQERGAAECTSLVLWCSTGAQGVPGAGDQRLPGHRRGPTRRWESHKILLLCLPPRSAAPCHSVTREHWLRAQGFQKPQTVETWGRVAMLSSNK